MKKSKDLLILDLDNTLIAAVHSVYIDGIDYPSDFISNNHHVNMRPYLQKFMEYALINWRVGIWTAATREYAEGILIKCNIDINKFEFIKVREDCTKGTDIDFSPIYIKDLSTLNEDLSRVILIDDKKESAQKHLDNIIIIPAYISAAQTADNRLLKLIDYLEELKKTKDFRSICKNTQEIFA